MARRTAFTLVELLVVVAIVALLIAILLPALSKARDAAKDTICKTRQRQIAQAFIMYATEYGDYLPPGKSNQMYSGNMFSNWTHYMVFEGVEYLGKHAGDHPSSNTFPEVYACPSADRASSMVGGSFGRYEGRSPVCYVPFGGTISEGSTWRRLSQTPSSRVLLFEKTDQAILGYHSEEHLRLLPWHPVDKYIADGYFAQRHGYSGVVNLGGLGELPDTTQNLSFVDGHVSSLRVAKLYERYTTSSRWYDQLD